MTIQKKDFIIEGMTCTSCEKIIKKEVKKLKGVKNFKLDFVSKKANITYDTKEISLNKIFKKIDDKGYQAEKENKQKENYLGTIFTIIGVIVAVYFIFNFVESINVPSISMGMSYGLLLMVGLLTGFHCVAMCGGFVVSYTASDAKAGRNSYESHLMYGTGKTISYAIIGAMFGLLGSIIAFTPMIRGVAGILAGIFLILFGIKMLDVFPTFRKLNIKTPKFVSRFVGKESVKHSNPFIIGLLNGLMIACGPLQAIYIMAAGTGSMVEGAKLLFIFGIGTLPAMLGFGYFATLVSSKMTRKILKASGIIVLIMGLLMLNNGITLTGSGYDFNTLKTTINTKNILENNEVISNNVAVLKDGYQEIRMDVMRSGWIPDKFILKKGVPVKWIINGKEITGCNNAIQVPKYGLKFDIKPGEQTIEFTPTESGVIPWSCWMGMIPGTFIVTDDIDNVKLEEELQNTIASAPTGTCGGTSGGCGCGAR